MSSVLVTMALAELSVTLWLATHRYHRFQGDAQIYAFQALARIHEALRTDLFLSNGSQDRFTIFPDFYALCVRLLGLEAAALALTLTFTVWFFAATWFIARRFSTPHAAWLAVALLIITGGEYGAYGVFHFSEAFLTARLPAEAMIATALVLRHSGHTKVALATAMLALCVHPLMAFPGLLLVICASWPPRATVLAATAIIAVGLAVTLISATMPAALHLMTLIDASWLAIVRERSQFLFLQLWSAKDWAINVRPVASLALTAVVLQDRMPVRRVCIAAICIGTAGIAVAAIASYPSSPVALLLQGQPWRWIWLASMLSVLLLPATVIEAWRDLRCGPLFGVLLFAVWTLPALSMGLALAAAIVLWTVKDRLTVRAAEWLRYLTILITLLMFLIICSDLWKTMDTPLVVKGSQGVVERIRAVMGIQAVAALLALVCWFLIARGRRSLWVGALATLVLGTACAEVAPFAFTPPDHSGSESDLKEFEDWRNAIPPTSTVFVADGKNTGLFVWFTLERPNYLTKSQSAGVVFSRDTALEVKRRAHVLSPLESPSWMIMTQIAETHSNANKQPSEIRPLTAQTLADVCADPLLGFVISKEEVGFAPVKHGGDGSWKNWNLYDCRSVRRAAL